MIYVVGELEQGQIALVKVGFTAGVLSDPLCVPRMRSRLSSIQTGNPRQVVLLRVLDGDRTDEHNLHRRFAADRVSAGQRLTEWFRFSPAMRAWVESVPLWPWDDAVRAFDGRAAITTEVLAAHRHGKQEAAARRQAGRRPFVWRGRVRTG